MFVSLPEWSTVARRPLVHAAIVALSLGCTTRDRPITPSGTTGPGGGSAIPLVTITDPGGDTVVTEGQSILIRGNVQDDLAVDSIFIDVQGGSSSILPLDVNGPVVPFEFQISTAGLAGTVVTISITANDEDGNTGGPAVRLLSVR